MGSSLQENDTKINPNLQEAIASVKPNEQQAEEPRDEISKSVSEDKIGPVTPLSHSQQYNPRMKRKAFTGRISPLWGRFQNKRESKSFKEDFNFKMRGKFH